MDHASNQGHNPPFPPPYTPALADLADVGQRDQERVTTTAALNQGDEMQGVKQPEPLANPQTGAVLPKGGTRAGKKKFWQAQS